MEAGAEGRGCGGGGGGGGGERASSDDAEMHAVRALPA